jgi:hypothetical protein
VVLNISVEYTKCKCFLNIKKTLFSIQQTQSTLLHSTKYKNHRIENTIHFRNNPFLGYIVELEEGG